MPKNGASPNEPQIRHNRRPSTGAERTQSRRFASNSADWGGVSNQTIRDVVVAVADSGASILLGKTGDGGAFVVQVYDGDDAIREYPHTVEELEAVLRWVTDIYAAS